jgi:hypothetical protein
MVNYDAYEKISNHYLDLTAIVPIGKDTSRLISASAYYSNQLRLYRDEENRSLLPLTGMIKMSDHRSSTRGLLVKHTWETASQNLLAIVQAEQVRVESSPEVGFQTETKISGSAREEVHITQEVDAAVFGRLDHYRDQFLAGGGADATLLLSRQLSVFGGVGMASRTPTLQELYWSSDSLQRPTPRLWLQNEIHRVLEAGVRFVVFDFIRGKIAYQHRDIQHPIMIDTSMSPTARTAVIEITQGDKRSIDQLTVEARASIGEFVAEGMATYLHQPALERKGRSLTLSPALTMDGSFYYRGLLADGHLDMKIGIRGRFVSVQSGMSPLPESGFVVPSPYYTFGPSGTMDFFVIAQLGDAYLHFIWENVTANQYFLTPFYPMYGSNVRFGVSWEFLN